MDGYIEEKRHDVLVRLQNNPTVLITATTTRNTVGGKFITTIYLYELI
jgi:hypothetical protein